MATILYKDGQPHRVQTQYVNNALINGYTTESKPVATPVVETDAELEAARELYEEKFGKKAHHKKTFATIMAELEDLGE